MLPLEPCEGIGKPTKVKQPKMTKITGRERDKVNEGKEERIEGGDYLDSMKK